MARQRDLGKRSVQLQLPIGVAERASEMSRVIFCVALSRVIEPMVAEWCAKHAHDERWEEHLRKMQEPIGGYDDDAGRDV